MGFQVFDSFNGPQVDALIAFAFRAGAETHLRSNCCTHAYSHTDRYSDTHSHAYRDADAHSHTNSHADRRAHSYSYADGYCHANAIDTEARQAPNPDYRGRLTAHPQHPY